MAPVAVLAVRAATECQVKAARTAHVEPEVGKGPKREPIKESFSGEIDPDESPLLRRQGIPSAQQPLPFVTIPDVTERRPCPPSPAVCFAGRAAARESPHDLTVDPSLAGKPPEIFP